MHSLRTDLQKKKSIFATHESELVVPLFNHCASCPPLNSRPALAVHGSVKPNTFVIRGFVDTSPFNHCASYPLSIS
jgi:hypothetical protein